MGMMDKNLNSILKARGIIPPLALQHQQQQQLPNANDLLMMNKSDLNSISALAGKPTVLPPFLRANPPNPGTGNSLFLARQHQALEHEASRLRLELALLQQQRLPPVQRRGFNFCSAA